MSGSFALGNDSYEFDGKGLFCNGDLLFNYNYSPDVMGVGESFSIYNSSGEFLYSLRPSGKFFSRRLTLFDGTTKLFEISRSFLGTRFTVQAYEDLLPGLTMLCLWVAMTKMSCD